MMNALESNMELFASKKFSWISPVNKLLDVQIFQITGETEIISLLKRHSL